MKRSSALVVSAMLLVVGMSLPAGAIPPPGPWNDLVIQGYTPGDGASGTPVTDNFISSNPADQLLEQKGRPGRKVHFQITVQNTVPTSGIEYCNASFPAGKIKGKVIYELADVTSEWLDATYSVDIAASASLVYVFRASIGERAKAGTSKDFSFTCTSSVTAIVDSVTARVAVK